MKNVVYGILFLGLVGLGFVGCKKNELSPPNNQAEMLELNDYSNDALKNNEYSYVENIYNPYDYAGVKHNESLIDFYENAFFNIEYEIKDESDVLSYFLKDEDFKTKFIEYNILNLKDEDPLNYPDVLKNLHLEHKEVFGIYNQIKEIVLNNEYSLFEKIDAIQLLENNVVLEDSEGIFSTYNESEMENIKMCIWLSASVARYSLYLWNSEEEGGFGLIDKLGNPKEYFIFSPEVSTNWKENNFTYNGKSKLNTNRLKRKDPPEWVYDDLWGTWTSALFTGNPFTAIAGGAVSSAVGELRRRY